MELSKKSVVLVLSLLSLILINACTLPARITDVDICIEIPFLDGPEGACTNSVKGKSYLVSHEKWTKMRPGMLMLDAKHWTKIKLDWLKACRMAKRDGAKKCNIQLKSIDKAVTKLLNFNPRENK